MCVDQFANYLAQRMFDASSAEQLDDLISEVAYLHASAFELILTSQGIKLLVVIDDVIDILIQ